MPNPTADAVVIGAGVIGCGIAYTLARQGWSVAVVAREGAPGLGSTSASSAIIRFNYSTLAGVSTSWEAKFAWESWPDFLGGPDDDGRVARFVKTGAFCLDSPALDPGKVLPLFDQVGVPYQVWDAATLRERVPGLDAGRFYPPKPIDDDAFWAEPSGELGAFFMPEAGFVDDPQFAAHNLATAARRLGARFVFKATVTGVVRSSTPEHERVAGVELADGSRIDAPVVVNAAGPASGKVNALAGVLADFAVTTRPLRSEVHYVPEPPGYNGAAVPGPVAADLDLGTYWRGTPNGELLVGGTEPACDPLHWLDDADVYDERPTEELYTAQLYRTARRFPELTIPNRPKGIGAVYDVTDDWIPIYDRTALAGFYVAIGTSGNQFKNAPVVGRYLHAIIDACENGTDHDVTPVQVTLPVTGQVVDLAAFSRRRRINPDSSFTVMG
jgi:sarcosine oxidase, subunit beta